MTNEEFKNLQVGKKFTCGNKNLLVKEAERNGCKDCIMEDPYNNCTFLQDNGIIPECFKDFREDDKDVIFVEVEDDK